MDQVIIKDLLVRGVIGVNPEERDNEQDILINLVLFNDQQRAGETDDLADSVSYSAVANKIAAHVKDVRRFTVEALAADLARLCLEEPGVQRVRVRVEKPHAVLLARSVGVEIERGKLSGDG